MPRVTARFLQAGCRAGRRAGHSVGYRAGHRARRSVGCRARRRAGDRSGQEAEVGARRPCMPGQRWEAHGGSQARHSPVRGLEPGVGCVQKMVEGAVR